MRRRLAPLPRFVVTRGGEHCFLPSLSALRWLGDLERLTGRTRAMDTLHLVLNAVTVIFIASTMFAAGLRATVPALRGVFADVPLLSLALIANMVVIPLLGWGIGALFGLPSASFIALVLIASSPGGHRQTLAHLPPRPLQPQPTQRQQTEQVHTVSTVDRVASPSAARGPETAAAARSRRVSMSKFTSP